MMIWIYNFILFILTIISLPIIFVKSISNSRIRYKILDRFFPKSINLDNYGLIHASSFGEIKTVLSFIDRLEKDLGLKLVLSVFTDTAHKFIADNKSTVLMPLDLYPLYKKIFKNTPTIAFFFETEIWPSYIFFLKKHNTKLILINARMSQKSFKTYRNLRLLFTPTIKKFDLIIAKTKEDAKRFKYFNKKVIVCGNIKQFKEKKVFDNAKENLKINSNKKILILASFHKEEVDIAIKIIKEFNNDFFIVLAPRHIEDVPLFEKKLKANSITYIKRTSEKKANNLLLLDTLGELEKVYSISDITILGGSFYPSLKGHNPMEPILYANLTITGEFTGSFSEEIFRLKGKNLIYVVKNNETLIQKLRNIIFTEKKPYINNFKEKYILDCYIFNTLKAYHKI